MLDIRRIRAEPEAVKAALARRGHDTSAIDEVVELDRSQRSTAEQRDLVRRDISNLSKQVGQLRRSGSAAESDELMARSRALGDDERTLTARADDLATEVREHLLRIANTPAPECPDGADEHANVVLRVENFDPDSYAPHQRVPHSYEEIRPPTLVRTDTMIATGHLPKFADDAYYLERDDLWAIPTAEVPLTSLARDEILDESVLPMRLMAHTSCFRREAGSAGRDTRGLLRVHEFDKVEILAYTTPEQASAAHDDILGRAEALIRDLGLAYRIVDICTGDLGSSSARTWDIEVYAPGADRWLEVSSCSWFADYQARRANIRYRPAGQKGTQLVNTLNGSALAVPRVWAALVETYRQPDGTIALPDVLAPYLRGDAIIPTP